MHTDTVADTLKLAAGTLAAHSESPRLDAEVLLGKVLGSERTALIVRGAERLSRDQQHEFLRLLERRVGGAPVAYLTGEREFWSLGLKVSPAVLVPRPETELLVELALARLPPREPRTVLDLGTGSGAIAIAIASERPSGRITGTDVSAAALEVARENARSLALCDIRWRCGSWFEAVPAERFDLIVSNPPYVAAADPALAALRAEPELALTSGPTGLEALELIAAQAPAHLLPGGSLLLEHGSTQAAAVTALLERAGFGAIRSHADFSGLPRVTLGTFHPPT
jgi:release factor glutamine methyltransferase